MYFEKCKVFLPRQGQKTQEDHLGDSSDQKLKGMPSSGVDVDLVIAKSMVAKLSVVVHDLVLGLNHLWVVLEAQVTSNETTVEFDDLRNLKFTMGRLVQTASRLDHLETFKINR